MRVLLDTHVLFWWLEMPNRLSPGARLLIGNPNTSVHVSIATLWEMAIKAGLGRWPEARQLVDDFDAAMVREGFNILPITVAHIRAAGLMQSPHRDPFDRLLAAQAQIEGLTIVTVDPAIIGLGAPTLS